MSRIDFLEKYATEGKHYDIHKELDKAVLNPSARVRSDIAYHPKLQSTHLDVLVNDPNFDVRNNVSYHPNLSPQNIDKLVMDNDVAPSIASHPNLSLDNFRKLKNSSATNILSVLKMNPKYKEYYK